MFSITKTAFAEGVTVQAGTVYTGDAPAVCEVMFLRCPTAVGVVVSCTMRIWKLRYSFASTAASAPAAVPVMLVADDAVAVNWPKNPSPGFASYGTYDSSRPTNEESVLIVAGRFVVARLAEKELVAMS